MKNKIINSTHKMLRTVWSQKVLIKSSVVQVKRILGINQYTDTNGLEHRGTLRLLYSSSLRVEAVSVWPGACQEHRMPALIQKEAHIMM